MIKRTEQCEVCMQTVCLNLNFYDKGADMSPFYYVEETKSPIEAKLLKLILLR